MVRHFTPYPETMVLAISGRHGETPAREAVYVPSVRKVYVLQAQSQAFNSGPELLYRVEYKQVPGDPIRVSPAES